MWVCSGAQDPESERFSSMWESVARRLAAADLASWEVWVVCLRCLVFRTVTGGRRLYSLHVRLMWANRRKQEGSFIFSVCVCLSDAYVVEVKELYNTWKKSSISISVAVTLLFFFFFYTLLFFSTVTLQSMYALGIYWHYTLMFEMLFAFAHDIQFSMQLL